MGAKGVRATDATISFADTVLAILVATLADARTHWWHMCAISDRAFFTRSFCFLVNANAHSSIAFRACVFLPFVDADLTASTRNASAVKPSVLAISL